LVAVITPPGGTAKALPTMQTQQVRRLPEELSSFVGRDAEVTELRELLRKARAVTLCGAGGIGKTRLALRLLAAIAQDFPDGAWCVELGEVSRPEHVPGKVAFELGIDEEPGRPLLDTLADALRSRRALLVLDNCEHLIHSCADLCQRLLASAPALRVVATSREPMRIAAEAAWHVPPLAIPPADSSAADDARRYDAVRLFAERAGAAAPGFALTDGNAAAVTAICRALDGLPLAIELAAAWVRALSAGQIQRRLDHRLALLTSGERTVPARHRTLRATFDWSYDLLSDAERVLLRRLSVFGGWSLDMAEQLCADDKLPAADILDLITALADKSLLELESVTLGQARYRMLETIREYASELLLAAGEAPELYRRRLDYTVRESETALAIGMGTTDVPSATLTNVFKRVDTEEGNLREVMAGCLADGDAENGLRMCTAMRPVWIVHGQFAEAAQWLDAFLGLDSAASVSPVIRGGALIGRAQLALAIGEEEPADLAKAGLELCSAAGDRHWTAAGLNLLAEVALHAGQLDRAVAKADEALGVATSAADRWNESYALGTKAAAAGLRGSLREAQELGEQALQITRDIGQLWGAARAMLGLGDLARARGQHATARQYYVDALAILRELNARPDTSRCLAGLGRIAIDQSDLAAARRYLTDSLQLSYLSGSRIGMARGLETIARLAVLEGNPQTALRLAGAVSALRAHAHLPPIPGARLQRFLDAAQPLGEHAVARLWAEGLATAPAAAVRLALGQRPEDASQTAAADLRAGGLTPREREVVSLLADGASNRAIAAKLFISPATAARHVANILAKLGFTSRSQIAAWAAATTGQPPPPAQGTDDAGQLAPNSALTDSPS
jgi:predicted ATPase/DNA-binding CsgD family transcriptional regulator